MFLFPFWNFSFFISFFLNFWSSIRLSSCKSIHHRDEYVPVHYRRLIYHDIRTSFSARCGRSEKPTTILMEGKKIAHGFKKTACRDSTVDCCVAAPPRLHELMAYDEVRKDWSESWLVGKVLDGRKGVIRVWVWCVLCYLPSRFYDVMLWWCAGRW